MLTGPQALTIFTIAKDEQVPASAKTSSFATPQGYYCTETNKLHLFIKGNEYCFIDMEEHEGPRCWGNRPIDASSYQW